MSTNKFRLFVGVDVSKTAYHAAFLPASRSSPFTWTSVESAPFKAERADFERLVSWIQRWASPDDTCVAVDHTGGYLSMPVVDYLQSAGCTVVYVPGKTAKQIKERLIVAEDKSDPIDSKILAYSLYLHHMLGFRLPLGRTDTRSDDRALALLHWSRLRQQLVSTRVQVVNRLRQLWFAAFPEGLKKHPGPLMKVSFKYPDVASIQANPELEGVPLRQSTRKSLLSLSKSSIGAIRPGLRDSIQLWGQFFELLNSQLHILDRRIEEAVSCHPYSSVLLSFPSIGPIRAGWLIGFIRDVGLWRNPAALKKAFGLYGVTRQSGATVHMVKGKSGNRTAKSLVMQVIASYLSSKAENDFYNCYVRHRSRGIPSRKAMYKAASKLVEVLYCCLKTGQEYQYQGMKSRPSQTNEVQAG